MVTIDKTYAVRWFGPFNSIDEVRDFEIQHEDREFQLYLLQGYKKCAKTRESYYCGQTLRSVSKRLSDEGHHISEISRLTAIWIGSITNVTPSKEDINVVEKILTAQMRIIFGEQCLLNQTNTKFPTYNAYVINIWHDKKEKRRLKYSKYSIPDLMPDLIGHEYIKDEYIQYNKIFGAPKIKWTDVEW